MVILNCNLINARVGHLGVVEVKIGGVVQIWGVEELGIVNGKYVVDLDVEIKPGFESVTVETCEVGNFVDVVVVVVPLVEECWVDVVCFIVVEPVV